MTKARRAHVTWEPDEWPDRTATSRIALCVFAKPPRAGHAKTRLATAIGDGLAAELARAFVLDTWALVSGMPWADPILATTDAADPVWAALPGTRVWPQGDGDLGDRMERVLRQALASYPAAIIVGTDIPGLPVEHLDAARVGLSAADAVIGPCEDGGFYLVGSRRCPPGLFDQIPWGTDLAYARTEERLRNVGLSLIRTPSWFDVDRPEDLNRLRALGDSLRKRAPATARVLERVTAGVRGEAS
ncbi:MAG: TIGR04282 family arsenosugar biosynthesis glycosyltransferase [Acidobacteria bacterium]|nr:TIGR04282 family arsenosugar biosynthesis glycosyltransferase [Acidobacteriota bacterium]